MFQPKSMYFIGLTNFYAGNHALQLQIGFKSKVVTAIEKYVIHYSLLISGAHTDPF